LLDEMEQAEMSDFVSEFAYPLPSLVIFERALNPSTMVGWDSIASRSLVAGIPAIMNACTVPTISPASAARMVHQGSVESNFRSWPLVDHRFGRWSWLEAR
jgi:hypothetical protein